MRGACVRAHMCVTRVEHRPVFCCFSRIAAYSSAFALARSSDVMARFSSSANCVSAPAVVDSNVELQLGCQWVVAATLALRESTTDKARSEQHGWELH
jgi:hypothetical protein